MKAASAGKSRVTYLSQNRHSSGDKTGEQLENTIRIMLCLDGQRIREAVFRERRCLKTLWWSWKEKYELLHLKSQAVKALGNKAFLFLFYFHKFSWTHKRFYRWQAYHLSIQIRHLTLLSGKCCINSIFAVFPIK